jgi:hypothetical protein
VAGGADSRRRKLTTERFPRASLAMIFLAAALACVGAPEEETFDYSVPSARVIEDFELGNWRHTRVGGFEVYTNASPESVHSSLVRLERFTSLVGNFIFPDRDKFP